MTLVDKVRVGVVFRKLNSYNVHIFPIFTVGHLESDNCCSQVNFIILLCYTGYNMSL